MTETVKLTKQGVRDLNCFGPPPPRVERPFESWGEPFCFHRWTRDGKGWRCEKCGDVR